jgi:Ni,Fe-hydrogenase III small subunit
VRRPNFTLATIIWVYDLERFGLRFVASPRHADVLLVTGPVTRNTREALQRTYLATPDPKWVVAVGHCATDGGIFVGSYGLVAGRPTYRRLPAFAPAIAQSLLGLLERGAAS